jgi:predicted nucleic acid-binding protein
MKLYFDTCCYNRPFDDWSQFRIRREAGAVLKIRGWCRRYGHTIFSSAVLDEEIGQISDVDRHRDVSRFYRKTATESAFCVDEAIARIKRLTAGVNIGELDALHLSFAESVGADYLLTTDDDFEKVCDGMSLIVKVINPLKFNFGGTV